MSKTNEKYEEKLFHQKYKFLIVTVHMNTTEKTEQRQYACHQ